MGDSGNNMGRPPLFDNPEALQAKVDEYFIWVLGEREWVVNDSGEREERVKRAACHTTVTGMALFLGFESRQSIYDYEERGDFSYIIKKARMKVEDAYEQRLHGTTPTGAIFALKNMGWKDRTEVAPVTPDGKALSESSDDDLKKLLTDTLSKLNDK